MSNSKGAVQKVQDVILFCTEKLMEIWTTFVDFNVEPFISTQLRVLRYFHPKLKKFIDSTGVLLGASFLTLFLFFLLSILRTCNRVDYVSSVFTNSKGTYVETVCEQVPVITINNYFITDTGIWSTKPDYVSKRSLFESTFASFSSTDSQFLGYLNSHYDKFNAVVFDKFPMSVNYKKIVGYRNASAAETLSTTVFVDFSSVFEVVDKSTSSWATSCGSMFSDNVFSDPSLTNTSGGSKYNLVLDSNGKCFEFNYWNILYIR